MSSEEARISRLERADALGLAFLRTIILLNAGAILAILTFIGNATSDSQIIFDISSVRCAMRAFLLGILSTLVGLIISYSYTATTPEHGWHKFWDEYLVRTNIVLAFVSVVAFAWGVCSLIEGSSAT